MTGDDKESIPFTDSSSYITASAVSFPSGTDALHIYNCMNQIYGNGEFSISGTYTVTESSKTYNLESVSIYPVYTSASKTEARTSAFYTVFTCTDGTAVSLCYEWQYSDTNVWQNTALPGRIVISLS